MTGGVELVGLHEDLGDVEAAQDSEQRATIAVVCDAASVVALAGQIGQRRVLYLLRTRERSVQNSKLTKILGSQLKMTFL